MKRLVTLVLLVVATASVAAAGDREYKAVVKAVEKHYRVRGKGLPWAARIALRLTRPMHGVEVKLAEFPELPARLGSMVQFEEVVFKAVGPGWTPMVRVYSHRTGEYTFLYTRQEKNKLVLLIAAIENTEAAIVQVKLKPEKLEKWIDNPVKLARGKHTGRQRAARPEVAIASSRPAEPLPTGVPIEQLTVMHFDSPIGNWKVSALR